VDIPAFFHFRHVAGELDVKGYACTERSRLYDPSGTPRIIRHSLRRSLRHGN
jgi:hypothetical protein